MRPRVLRRDLALAAVIALTMAGGVTDATSVHARDASRARAARALAAYRAQVRTVFTTLYDDVQPLEDAISLAGRRSTPDVMPLVDLMASGQPSTSVARAVQQLSHVPPPPGLAREGKALSGKLADLRAAVDAFPPLGRSVEDFDQRWEIAYHSMETSIYELSVALQAVVPDPVPRTPGPGESATRQPLSHASYIVAAAHICGPANAALDKLPDVDDVAAPGALPTIRATAVLMRRAITALLAVPVPPHDRSTLEADVRDPLRRDPSLPDVFDELQGAIEEHDEEATDTALDRLDTALTVADGVASAYDAFGVRSCAELLAAPESDGDGSLNA